VDSLARAMALAWLRSSVLARFGEMTREVPAPQCQPSMSCAFRSRLGEGVGALCVDFRSRCREATHTQRRRGAGRSLPSRSGLTRYARAADNSLRRGVAGAGPKAGRVFRTRVRCASARAVRCDPLQRVVWGRQGSTGRRRQGRAQGGRGVTEGPRGRMMTAQR